MNVYLYNDIFSNSKSKQKGGKRRDLYIYFEKWFECARVVEESFAEQSNFMRLIFLQH